LIILNDIQMQYSTHVILQGVNLQVAPDARMALIGGNGTGKSTLLKIIAGELEPESGSVERPREIRIGYLPQSGLTYRGRTLWEEMLTALPEWLEARKMRRELLEKISSLSPDDPEHQRAMNRYGELEISFQQEEGYAQESWLRRILQGLGFQGGDYDRPADQFSAGWQMRIGLAKLLARSPDFMLLDEPTDHLDLDAKNWLEGYLEGIRTGFILVSHDRYLLDRLVKNLAEIHNKKLELFSGNYTKYLQERHDRTEQNQERVNRQEKQFQKLETFIARNRIRKDRARQVQSRIKQLDKIERIEQEVRRPEGIRFQFQAASRPPRVLVQIQDLDKSFSGRRIFEGVNLTVERGERIAVVGPNGSGKSTLLRTLQGRERFDAGSRFQDEKVSIGWFSQDAGEGFKTEKTVLDAILARDPLLTQERARGLLARFQFRKDDVFKPVEALSGGERVRLALACLLLDRHHLLLLDEPTNHLDIQGRQALLEALIAYNGTLVFVSHDRYFIQELADRILEIREGVIQSFPGTYEEFVLAKEQGGRNPYVISRAAFPGSSRPGEEAETQEKESRIQEREERKAAQRADQKRKRQMSETEEEITELEAALALLENEMNLPAVAMDYSRLEKLHQKAAEIRESLQQRYALWEKLVSTGTAP